jgi:cytoskeleton protein RodZ
MNDEDKTADESTESPVGGERLRAARRANDISVRDVAKELHLDEHKVRALERNEFEVLGAPVFAKGHLRKYAELVGASIDDIMTDYYQMNRAAGAPPVVGPKRIQPSNVNPGPWLGGGVVVIVVAVAAYWWFALRTPAPEFAVEPATLAPYTAPADEQPEVIDEPQPEPLPAVDVADDSAEDVADTAPAVAETPARATPGNLPPTTNYEPTPGVPQVSVDLTFTGDCWTEVSDASGRRLFYDLGSEGRVVTLSGDAPLRVILGDSENVSVTVDGAAWPIPSSARSGRLARLTIDPR